MATLKREDIVAAQDIQKELVSVPEWGGEVWVYGLTGSERDSFEASIIRQRGGQASKEINFQNLRAKLCVMAMRDDNGERLFKDTGDIELLGKKSAQALQRVFDAAQRLSGLSPDDVEDLSKN